MSKPASIRVDLPPDENSQLDTLQRKLRDHLKVNFVSKASTIRFLIRTGSIPTTDVSQDQQ
jgi:phosphoketolase